MEKQDKLDMHTSNIIDYNFAALSNMFPNAVTETITGHNEKGEPIVERVIDADVLTQEINSHVINGKEERYQFTWPDKKKSILLANAPIAATLRPSREESVDFDNTENLYIEGDNLDVLKLLRETYLNRIKMIYIDPPYNTGNDFIYEDDFTEEAGGFLRRDSQYDELGNRLTSNLESNGRFHTDWLNLIYPRLRIARELLTDEGVIFISIDDHEVHNLRKMCDEIFGEKNFVANIVWQSRTSISNDYEVSLNHNHTIIYSKNRSKLAFGGDSLNTDEYVNPDNDERGPWKLVPIDANHIGGATYYPIMNPITGIEYYPPNGRIWAYNIEGFNKLLAEGRIKFGMTDESSPKKKLYLNERLERGDSKTPSSILLDAGSTKHGTSEIMSLFENKKIFDYPKPSSFLVRLLRYGCTNKNDIILDFFSGSATTAHAVMQLNAEDNASRRFIMVQIPEKTDSNSEAFKAGYKNICEIGKERIRRAGNKIKEEAGFTAQNLDVGFRVLKLDSSNMKEVYYSPEEYSQMGFNLEGFVDNIKPDRSDEDLLFQVMLDLGIPLLAKITRDGKIFSVNEDYLVACFDRVDTLTITEIAKKQPYYAVFLDSSFSNDSALANVEQIFSTYSPNTIRRVI